MTTKESQNGSFSNNASLVSGNEKKRQNSFIGKMTTERDKLSFSGAENVLNTYLIDMKGIFSVNSYCRKNVDNNDMLGISFEI